MEPHSLAAMLGRLDAKCCGDVGLSGAWPADQHDVVGLLSGNQHAVHPARRVVFMRGAQVGENVLQMSMN
jgi:hypothetical protein